MGTTEMKDKHLMAYMACAEVFATCSNATRLKVGSVIVKNNRIISCGYNGLPEHINGECEDANGVTRPEVRHSEINALHGLIKSNESAVDSTMFCTHSPCKMCAIDIVDSGVKKVYYRTEYRSTEGIKYLINNGIGVEKI